LLQQEIHLFGTAAAPPEQARFFSGSHYIY
jgi:hypothetical protein